MDMKGLEIYHQYWQAYGGCSALFKSPYLYFSIILLTATMPFWLYFHWWDQVISVIPNLLGFTLGGFAIFIGFGDEKFRALLAEPDNLDLSSLYVGLCATFVHFIVVQFLALVAAVIANAWLPLIDLHCTLGALTTGLTFIIGLIGYGLFLYAVTLMLASTMYVFRIGTWYEQYCKKQKQIKDEVSVG